MLNRVWPCARHYTNQLVHNSFNLYNYLHRRSYCPLQLTGETTEAKRDHTMCQVHTWGSGDSPRPEALLLTLGLGILLHCLTPEGWQHLMEALSYPHPPPSFLFPLSSPMLFLPLFSFIHCPPADQHGPAIPTWQPVQVFLFSKLLL